MPFKMKIQIIGSAKSRLKMLDRILPRKKLYVPFWTKLPSLQLCNFCYKVYSSVIFVSCGQEGAKKFVRRIINKPKRGNESLVTCFTRKNAEKRFLYSDAFFESFEYGNSHHFKSSTLLWKRCTWDQFQNGLLQQF